MNNPTADDRKALNKTVREKIGNKLRNVKNQHREAEKKAKAKMQQEELERLRQLQREPVDS